MRFNSTRSTTAMDLGVPLPRGWRILVVDDYKDTAEALTVLLQISGNECFTAYSGEECLSLARFHRPEIILLDLNMPDMDGFETCRLVKEEPWSKHVKIIAITGVDENMKRLHMQESGFDAHIIKPVDPEELAILLFSLGRGQPDLH